jgi:hypothetical protein
MIKNMPIELAPLGECIACLGNRANCVQPSFSCQFLRRRCPCLTNRSFAIVIAFYYGIKKFMTDKTLRLTRIRRDDK